MNKKIFHHVLIGILTVNVLTACGEAEDTNGDTKANPSSEEGLLKEDGVDTEKATKDESNDIPEDNSIIEDKEEPSMNSDN